LLREHRFYHGNAAVAGRVLLLLLLLVAVEACAGNYDPQAVDPAFHPAQVDRTVHDAARNRDIPVGVYLPTNTTPGPVILFSYGLGGSQTGSAFSASIGWRAVIWRCFSSIPAATTRCGRKRSGENGCGP